MCCFPSVVSNQIDEMNSGPSALASRHIGQRAGQILAPAFGRLMIFPLAMIMGFENLTFIKVLLISTPFVLAFILVTAWRFKQLHPALIFALIVNLAGFAVGPLGRSELWRSICDILFL